MTSVAPLPPPRRDSNHRWRAAATALPPFAGLLGAGGILVSAAAAHLGSSTIATTGGLFLLLHAGAVLGLAALANGRRVRRYIVAGWMLSVGALVFSGDLVLAGLYSLRPFPPAAPLGGLLLIAGWLVLPITAIAERFWRGASAR